jgi:hypothetical protein
MNNDFIHKNEILLAYKGPFCINILANFGTHIKHFGNNTLTESKLYKIFFELTQNVGRYSVERMLIEGCKDIGVGIFMLENFNHSLRLTTINRILKEQGPILADYCININKMNKNELRFLKSSKRNTDNFQTNSAHIGIIQIGILSSNMIDYKIDSIDNIYSRFVISTVINKKY